MKKLSIIVLMLIYGLSSSGITISIHYCCGKLDNVSLSTKETHSCKMGHLEKVSGCCDDKQFVSSIDADQEIATKYIQALKQTSALPPLPMVSANFKSNIVSVNLLARGSPGYPPSTPLFIKNCVFRI